MNAKTQYRLTGTDLETILALVRGGTLAAAAERLGVDASTVFRSIQRIERGMAQTLFERSRSGYLPSELAQSLAGHAEQMEVQLESARSLAQMKPETVSGTVRITTTDTILHGLIAPALKELRVAHPLLDYELHTGNELASLTRRDADIAVRATKRPPPHLVGRHIGPIRVAVYVSSRSKLKKLEAALDGTHAWIAPDDALPEHPSVLWRRRNAPKIVPAYRVNSILTVAELIELGLGVGIVPMFLAEARPGLRRLSDALDDAQTELWLLTHTESRHLRRVSTVFGHLAKQLRLR